MWPRAMHKAMPQKRAQATSIISHTPVWPALLVVEAQDVHQLMYDGVLKYQRCYTCYDEVQVTW